MHGGGGGGGGGAAHSDSFSISNFHVFILFQGGGRVQLGGGSFTPNVLNSLDIIKKTKGIRFDRTFSGADLARRNGG